VEFVGRLSPQIYDSGWALRRCVLAGSRFYILRWDYKFADLKNVFFLRRKM